MTTTIDFNDLSRGTVVDNEFSSQGVTITGFTAHGDGGRAMIFDTNRPTGGDQDLATENLGKVLIISEDGDSRDPDDNATGGVLRFDFAQPVAVQSLTLLDIDEGATLRFFNAAGALIATETVRTVDNAQCVAHFNVSGVARMDVTLNGSGAIDNLVFDAGNAAPLAANDAYSVDEDTAAVLGNVLSNDEDPDGDLLTVISVNGGAGNVDEPITASNGGLVTLNDDGSISFDPAGEFDDLGEGETRETAITYTVADVDGATATATVTIIVTGTNDGPVATDNRYIVTQDEMAGDVDGNAITDDTGADVDRDAEGDEITIIAVGGLAENVGKPVAGSAGGLFTIKADGTVDFDANGDFDTLGRGETVDTSISYTIVDESGATDTADITFTVTGKSDGTVQGTDGADEITPEIPYVDDDGDAVDAMDGVLPGDEGTDNDVIDAAGGDDSVDAGLGDDRVFGGQGDDQIAGNTGDDTLSGDAGNDTILGGEGDDTLFGGAGDDQLNGGADDVVISGGIGSDDINGGDGDDVIEGGAGADTIIGGAGRDALFGGINSDIFIGGNGGDIVIGGEDPNGGDVDIFDLRDTNVDRIEYVDGDPEAGTVFFNDGSSMTFAEIENVVPCFTPGTFIATPRGERPVEDLKVGDRVITRDNGIQEIAWLGRKNISGTQLVQNPHLQPVLIKRGSLGQGLPERDMMVSPNHRMLVSSNKTQLYFEENEVLAAAKHMVGADGIHKVDVMRTTYIHFMFERHEVVLANGAWTESFQPGDYSLKGIGNSQRSEIFGLFPELETAAGLEGYQAARKSLKKHEAEMLLD